MKLMKSKSSFEKFPNPQSLKLRFMTNSNIELSHLESGQKLQKTLQGGCPSFVKVMAESEVEKCFLLSVPKTFCKEHLPKSRANIVLEDEKGSEYVVSFLTPRCYLRAGWKAFALDHKLDVGDALVFQLTRPTRLKVHIAKVPSDDAEPAGKPVFEHSNLDENYNDPEKRLKSRK